MIKITNARRLHLLAEAECHLSACRQTTATHQCPLVIQFQCDVVCLALSVSFPLCAGSERHQLGLYGGKAVCSNLDRITVAPKGEARQPAFCSAHVSRQF